MTDLDTALELDPAARDEATADMFGAPVPAAATQAASSRREAARSSGLPA